MQVAPRTTAADQLTEDAGRRSITVAKPTDMSSTIDAAGLSWAAFVRAPKDENGIIHWPCQEVFLEYKAYATVELCRDGTCRTVPTDSEGAVLFADVAPGAYTIGVSDGDRPEPAQPIVIDEAAQIIRLPIGGRYVRIR
jgi:hypothetical protein